MWLPKNQTEKKGGNGLVAVAIDKDKNSQNALKWAIDNILQRGQTVILIHVKLKPISYSSMPSISTYNSKFSTADDSTIICKEPDSQTKELFLPFRCFCSRKDIQCKDIMLEDTDVAKALIEYVSQAAIENLVLGATVKTGFLRFKITDIPGSVGKGAPDFCNVYVISKGKIQSMRSAVRPAPANSALRSQILKQPSPKPEPVLEPNVLPPPSTKGQFCHHLHAAFFMSFDPAIDHFLDPLSVFDRPPEPPRKSYDEIESIRSPFTRREPNGMSYGELPALPDSDISFVSSSGRPSSGGRPSVDRMYPLLYDNLDSGRTTPRMSNSTDMDLNHSFESLRYGRRSVDTGTPSEFSSFSQDSDILSSSSPAMDDVEAEMRRLKLELKQTMEMYSTACKEALTAKQKAVELQRWKKDEERRLEEARLAEEAALAIADKERAKSKAAIEAAEAARRIADLEAQKRVNAELKAVRESEERKKAIDALSKNDNRYRRYSIEEIEAATGFFEQSRKIGEGGYGPVYKCYLDHTPAAIKVLRPDAAQGRSQFQQEVEVLSCIRHPNMVLLLGACPEYGCLVYEFMANGSLEDRLFCRGNTPPLSWQLRFRIAAEIGTGLLFLHQSKPEPLVHRDLKPANILLDRNFVSKISDVGLARLVPPSIADNVTQYRMTSTAGTFCYIDPEYQQTGMLGVKSDIYSLGIMFLQLITARPAMGLTHHVDRAIGKGVFAQMLDPSVLDWPIEEALSFAKLSLKCAELRRKDRPDLANVVLPELNRLRAFAEDNMQLPFSASDGSPTSIRSQFSVEHSSFASSNASSRTTSTTLMSR
ncbi:Phosphorylase kinase, gamma catalytic subunit [Parasponia andersonii]|uniref:RING-type E3 ubiquitin transferase n=1 Tax=Parasponia andersonii TaxID=3476 RepID=A0A2P5DT24_PARAD|nr:Phosphorylase kinase, gamma catalytic subunit [Parasponia andersonii]